MWGCGLFTASWNAAKFFFFLFTSDRVLPCWRSIDAIMQSSPIIFEQSRQFRASCLAMVALRSSFWKQSRGLSEANVKSKQHFETRVSLGVKSHSFKAKRNLWGCRTAVYSGTTLCRSSLFITLQISCLAQMVVRPDWNQTLLSSNKFTFCDCTLVSPY